MSIEDIVVEDEGVEYSPRTGQVVAIAVVSAALALGSFAIASSPADKHEAAAAVSERTPDTDPLTTDTTTTEPPTTTPDPPTTTTTDPPPPPTTTDPPPTTTAPAPPPVSSSGWNQVAICEEGGRDDPTYGYFGILPSTWDAYGGEAYSAYAGGSSWDTQVMIGDKINGGGAPWAPSGCASAGYHGW